MQMTVVLSLIRVLESGLPPEKHSKAVNTGLRAEPLQRQSRLMVTPPSLPRMGLRC